MVLPSVSDGGAPSPVIIDEEYQAETLSGPGEIAERGADLQGEVVRFENDGVGARVSARETLLSVLPCGEDLVVVPGVGCLPAVTDSVVHTGVFLGGGDLVPYAGASNAKQSVPVTDERGRYEVVGRVVSGERVGADGSALLVYRMERVGDLSVSSGIEAAEQQRDKLVERAQREINSSERQYSYGPAGGDDPATTTQPPETSTAGPGTTTAPETSTSAPPTDRPTEPQRTTEQDSVVAKAGGGDGGFDTKTAGLIAGWGFLGVGVSGIVLSLGLGGLAYLKQFNGRRVSAQRKTQLNQLGGVGFLFALIGFLALGFTEDPYFLTVASLLAGGTVALVGANAIYEWL